MTDWHAVVGIVGGGWRASYALRAARELPGNLTVKRVLVRTASSASRVRDQWGVPVGTSWSQFIAERPYDFVLVAVAPQDAPTIIRRVVRADIPVLTETPPATSKAGLFTLYRSLAGAPVEVAEQFRYQPEHASRKAMVATGLLGNVHHTRVSVAHGYHGVSLTRDILTAGFAAVEVRAHTVPDPQLSVRDRDAWREQPVELASPRDFAFLNFGESVGHYEFDREQYFSPIRPRFVEVYGTRGYIANNDVGYLNDEAEPVHETLRRETAGQSGDLEGQYLRRVVLGDRTLWRNPNPGARLNDDELAFLESLARMRSFVATGRRGYPLAEGCHDQLIGLAIRRSARTGRAVRVDEAPWLAETSVLTEARGGS